MERVHAIYTDGKIIGFVHVTDTDALRRARELYAKRGTVVGEPSWTSLEEAREATAIEPKYHNKSGFPRR